MNFLQEQLLSWLPKLNRQVWILVAGRLLSGIGTGFTLFYAPIFFADRVGLTKTAVGLALGSASISGAIARVVSGFLIDSPAWGRRRTLLLANFISAIASFVLAAANNFPTLVVGNLLMGVGVGFYWPATETAIADLTTPDNRQEAYAITRLSDNLGMQLGIVLGGILIALTGAYRALFVIDGISFLVFFAAIWLAIAETYQPVLTNSPSTPLDPPQPPLKKGGVESSQFVKNGWAIALRDRALLVYVVVNVMFTIYISQIQTTMPLYFTNFVSVGDAKGFSPAIISGLFTWHLALSIVFQLPVSRYLNRFSHPKALIGSALLWGVGFILICLTGLVSFGQLFWAILGLGVLAIATVAYTPSASSLVVNLAPESLRGVYLSINSQCWAIGYFIGPPLGGWVLDRGQRVADNFWLALSASVAIAIAILYYLDRLVAKRNKT